MTVGSEVEAGQLFEGKASKILKAISFESCLASTAGPILTKLIPKGSSEKVLTSFWYRLSKYLIFVPLYISF